MAPLVDGHSHAVEDYCLAMPGLSSRHHMSGQVMKTGCSRGEGVSLAVKFFGDGADEPKVDAVVTKVAGHFFDTKHIGFGLHASINLGPELGMGALRRGITIKDVLESINHGFVVNEDVYRSLSAGSEMDDGQCLSNLSVLGKAMDSGVVVHAVRDAVVDSIARSREEWYGLVSACSVRGRIGPGPARGGVGVGGVGVRPIAWRGRSWNGLRERVSGQFRLKIEKCRVFVEEATVAGVRWEPGPLLVTDKVGEWSALPSPALAVSDRVLLGLFLFVTVAAERAWVRRGVGA